MQCYRIPLSLTVWKLAPHSTAPHSNLIRLIVMKGRNALVYAARASAYKIEKGYVVRGISRNLSLGGGGGGGGVWAKGRHLTAENTLSATLAGFVYSHGRIQQRAI